jgi:hypothetical protein
MLWGPPGVGKSQMIAEVAERNGVPLIDIRLSQMEPSDLRGIPFKHGDLVEWAIPGHVAERRTARSRGGAVPGRDHFGPAECLCGRLPANPRSAAGRLRSASRLGHLRGRQPPG